METKKNREEEKMDMTLATLHIRGIHRPPLAPSFRTQKSQSSISLRQWEIQTRRILLLDRKRATTHFICSAHGATGDEPTTHVSRILWSDVVVGGRRNEYPGRKWTALDIASTGAVLLMHVLCLFAPFTFTWSALYVTTGLLGITLSYHRNLAHRSFRLPKWLEYTFAYFGVHALQGTPLDWVRIHRCHHQHCDSYKDPHSPVEGFWHSHVGWIFDTAVVDRRCGESRSNVGDMEKQPFYRFLQQTYVAHPIALALLLYLAGGVPYIVWGMGVRIVWVYHITWLVNSACHVWGKQPWNTGDLSRNNWWVAVLAFGEGWHNNHHAFEHSARHGLEWWQVDMTWYTVRLLQAVGLTTEVRLPTERQMQRMSFKAEAAA